MKNLGFSSLSPIPKIDIMSPPSSDKKIKLKKKLEILDTIDNNQKKNKIKTIFNSRINNDRIHHNNSQSKTKDISYHSLSRNNTNIPNGYMGYYYKNLLNKNNGDKFFSTTYHNEKFTKNLNECLSKLINEKSSTIIFDYISKTNNNESNPNDKIINMKKNIEIKENTIHKRSISNFENDNLNLLHLFPKERKNSEIEESKKLDLETLHKYYENLTDSDFKNYTNRNNYKTISNFKDFSNNELQKTLSTNYYGFTSRARRVSMKSVIDRIENIEKRNSVINNYYPIPIVENVKTIKNNIFKNKKKRRVYPEKRRVSQFDLIPKKRKMNKRIFVSKNKNNNENNKPINLIENNILVSREDPNETYRLPENLLEVRQRLGKQIKFLVDESLKSNFNITNDQILFSLEKTQKSEYTKDIIEKIKIINNVLSTYPKEKFDSELLRHRKIFVIIDGTVVFNEEIIKGNFIDIPTRRYLTFLENKKERLEEYYKFLSRCQRIFRSIIPFKNIFLLNGINIFDLIEIPDSDNAIFISTSNIFRGIHLFWDDQINVKNVKKKDYKLLKIQECKRALYKFTKSKFNNKQKRSNRRSIWTIIKKRYQKSFKTYVKKKEYLEDSSFTFGYTDIKYLNGEEKYYYYSEDEKKVQFTYKKLKQQYPTLLQQLIYFNEIEMKKDLQVANKKNERKLKNYLSNRVDEETFDGLNYLMSNYNNLRGKRDKIKIHQNMKSVLKEMQTDLNNDLKGLFAQFLRRLNILNNKNNNDIEVDEDRFYDTEKKLEEKLKKSIIHKNIIEINDIAHHATREINKYYPDLISMNIPAVLKAYPKLKRRVFYDIFIQYKNLLTLCVCINRDLKKIKKGLDFPTFFNCLPQMKSQGHSQAMKLYNTLNKLNTDYLNWEEFMQGMLSMKSNNISDKIDIFFNVIDADGNGLLSFDEVYEISKGSLQRVLGDKSSNDEEDDEVVSCLATYFANLIFQLVDMPIWEEIPMDKIKEKILEGQSAAGYLEMFICADSFT